MTEFMKIFQELLDDNNLTIRSFSEKIDTPYQVLYSYKNQDYYPALNIAEKIANYFDCSLNYLFGVDEYLQHEEFKPMNVSEFYPRYIALLEKNNTSHYFLYTRIGLNNSSITKWKNGAVPKIESLKLIAEYFNVSIDYLVGRSDSY